MWLPQREANHDNYYTCTKVSKVRLPLGLPGDKGFPGRAGSDGIPGEKGEIGDRGQPGKILS